MALSEFYESTIIKVSAGFGYSQFDCDPDTITRTLGISPDEIFRKGEKHTSPLGKILRRPFNSWGILSRSTSKDVNVHLRELLDRLGERYELGNKEWGSPHFGIVWKNNYLYAGTGPFFEADILEGIARWKAELYQDIYYVGQDKSEEQS